MSNKFEHHSLCPVCGTIGEKVWRGNSFFIRECCRFCGEPKDNLKVCTAKWKPSGFNLFKLSTWKNKGRWEVSHDPFSSCRKG